MSLFFGNKIATFVLQYFHQPKVKLKTVLIISPHFPPVNSPDMHRLRQSLPYFKKFGWRAVVLAIDAEYIKTAKDDLLLLSVPKDAEIVYTKALPEKVTRKFGFGNPGYRSIYHFIKEGNKIIGKNKIDLIYFTTTMFPVIVLGRYWKRKWKIPYVVDMQDPWRSDFYLDKPSEERPPKFWLSYRLEKILEAYAMKKADGLIAVSEGYIKTLKERYPEIKDIPSEVITFGFEEKDISIALNNAKVPDFIIKNKDKINIVYVGRGGYDLSKAINIFFSAVKKGLDEDKKLFGNIHLYFVGTSYAPAGTGIKTIEPHAKTYGIENYVTEITDRIPYFTTLSLLYFADILFIPGSIDTNYTASKLYPYIFAQKPLLAVFNKKSSVVDIIGKTKAGYCLEFENEEKTESLSLKFYVEIKKYIKRIPFVPDINKKELNNYKSEVLTEKQVALFNEVPDNRH